MISYNAPDVALKDKSGMSWEAVPALPAAVVVLVVLTTVVGTPKSLCNCVNVNWLIVLSALIRK